MITADTTLAQLLDTQNLAEVGRRIGVPRAYVWRLRWGQPLYDDALIEPLAALLRVDTATLAQIVKNDRVRRRRERTKRTAAA